MITTQEKRLRVAWNIYTITAIIVKLILVNKDSNLKKSLDFQGIQIFDSKLQFLQVNNKKVIVLIQVPMKV